jgi:transposase-like protein
MKAEMLSEDELGVFLRTEGIHEATLKEWRESVFSAATGALKDSHRKKSENTPMARRIRELERELRRKEKALAEAAALLVLKKKLDTFFGEGEDESTPERNDS